MPVPDAKKRFGPFELDSRSGELRTNGIRIKLQGQPISVLEILLETPGELVTREQIHQRLWSSDTFVDFDHNLNTAIKKLRQALGDEAETPRYIETVPRYGYRFIGQVEKDAPPELSGAETEAEAPIPVAPIKRAAPASHVRRALPWALGATTILFAAVAVWLMLKPEPRPNVFRFPVPPPENARFINGGEMSISPDGRTLAFVALPEQGKPPVLWLRPLDGIDAQQVPGSVGVEGPFWSPDSRQIGFTANGELEKVDLSGGAPQILCDANGFAGATWSHDGVILFSSQGSLYRVPETGGTPSLVLAPDPSHQEVGYLFPQFLPDGQHFIFETNITTFSGNFVGAGSLGSKTVERLVQVNSQGVFAAPGYLFYMDRGTLAARAFDARARHFTGLAVPVVQNIGINLYSNYAYFSVSPAGVLAYQAIDRSTMFGIAAVSQMIWFNRAGEKLAALGQTAIYTAPAFSADGTRLALSVGELGKRDIWVYDLKRGPASRLTFGPGDNTNTAWSADGSRIVFSSNRSGQFDIYQKAADGLGSEQLVFQSKDQPKRVDDMSSDGRYAIYDTGTGPTTTELWALPLFGDRKPFAFVRGNFGAHSAQFSPNVRFVAYTSNETGREEIYVQTFPGQTAKWQISASGGTEPMWNCDGKELFYLSPDGELMAVDVNTNAAAFQAGVPKPQFQTQLDGSYRGRNMYVVSPDGKRFLMIVPASQAKPEPITVVVNWSALLKSGGK